MVLQLFLAVAGVDGDGQKLDVLEQGSGRDLLELGLEGLEAVQALRVHVEAPGEYGVQVQQAPEQVHLLPAELLGQVAVARHVGSGEMPLLQGQMHRVRQREGPRQDAAGLPVPLLQLVAQDQEVGYGIPLRVHGPQAEGLLLQHVAVVVVQQDGRGAVQDGPVEPLRVVTGHLDGVAVPLEHDHGAVVAVIDEPGSGHVVHEPIHGLLGFPKVRAQGLVDVLGQQVVGGQQIDVGAALVGVVESPGEGALGHHFLDVVQLRKVLVPDLGPDAHVVPVHVRHHADEAVDLVSHDLHGIAYVMEQGRHAPAEEELLVGGLVGVDVVFLRHGAVESGPVGAAFGVDGETRQEHVHRMDEVIPLLVDEGGGGGLVVSKDVHEIDEGVVFAGDGDAVAVEEGPIDGKGRLRCLVGQKGGHSTPQEGLVAVAFLHVGAEAQCLEEPAYKGRKIAHGTTPFDH